MAFFSLFKDRFVLWINYRNNWLIIYIINNFRGKNVLNQKSELQKALSKHKEKKIMNQVKEHRETPGEFDLWLIYFHCLDRTNLRLI